MPKIVAQTCPRCGAPVSAGHTLLTCEFCGAELMMVKTNVAPPMPPPQPDFGSVGAFPAPSHVAVHVMPRRRGNPAIAIVVAVFSMLILGGVTAGILFASRPAPMPPIVIPPTTVDPATPITPVTVPTSTNVDPSGMIGMTGFLEARCNAKDAQSCHAVAILYQQGQAGLPADKEKAKTFFAKACALGDKNSCSQK